MLLKDWARAGRRALVSKLAPPAPPPEVKEVEIVFSASTMTLKVPAPLVDYYRAFEPETIRFFEGSLAFGMRAVDVGAHIGCITLLASRLVGDAGHVWSFEPAPLNIDLLASNLAAQRASNVTFLPVAVGAASGVRDLNLTNGTDCNTFFDHPMAAKVGSVPVPLVRLDDVVTGPVDLLKVDVEGAEIEVLEGAAALLRGSPRATLVVELNPACLRSAGRDPEDLVDMLESLGFACALIGSEATPREVIGRWRRDEVAALWYGNLVARRS